MSCRLGAQGHRRDQGAASKAGLRRAFRRAGFAGNRNALEQSDHALGAKVKKLKVAQRLALGVGTILVWIFLWLRPARPDLIVVVEHWPGRSRVSVGGH